jgi:hypothetical protein
MTGPWNILRHVNIWSAVTRKDGDGDSSSSSSDDSNNPSNYFDDRDGDGVANIFDFDDGVGWADTSAPDTGGGDGGGGDGGGGDGGSDNDSFSAGKFEDSRAELEAKGYTVSDDGKSVYNDNGQVAGEGWSGSSTVNDIVSGGGDDGGSDPQETFNEAFAAARAAQGAGGTFTWNGQQYSTDTAEDVAARNAAAQAEANHCGRKRPHRGQPAGSPCISDGARASEPPCAGSCGSRGRASTPS